jgi:aryl-alcohol dehydrogenase-like predicted oxidoreductase
MITDTFTPLSRLPHSRPLIWIGTWSAGGEGYGRADGKEVKRMLEQAFDTGYHHYDTAGFYAHGRSEELLKGALHAHRRSIFISTKGGLKWQGNTVIHDGSREGLREDLTQSLRRLKTDYIDLFSLHWPDQKVDLAESLTALADFQKEGLIRFYGVCNLTASDLRRFIAEGSLLPHQVHFNPLHRSDDILQAGRDHQRCFNCIITPLEQGLLASSFEAEHAFEMLGKKDIRRKNPYFRDPAALAFTAKLAQLAGQQGFIKSAAVILWILAQEAVDTVIMGPRTLSQLAEIDKVYALMQNKKLLNAAGYLAPLHAARQEIQHSLTCELWDLLESYAGRLLS